MHEFFLIEKNEAQDDDFFIDFYREKDNHKEIIVDYTTLEMDVFD